MRLRHTSGLLLSFVSAVVSSQIQSDASGTQATIALGVKSTVDVPFMGSPAIVAPVSCGENGEILLRTAVFNSVGNVVAITPDGKQKANYRIAKISDVTQPVAVTFFQRSGYLYLLLRGSKGGGETRQVKRPDGPPQTVLAFKDVGYFIAKYNAEGDYLGSTAIDAPLIPFQFGVFENGDFLIAGVNKDRHEPRVGLAKSNGQFIKFLDIHEDVQLKTSETKAGSRGGLPADGSRPGEGFTHALQLSRIVADRSHLLLIRRVKDFPVFRISPGGEVKEVVLDTPPDYRIWDLRPTGDSWVTVFTRRISDTAGVQFVIVAIDPGSGKALKTYAYPRFPGFGLACTDGNEFSFLVNEDDRLKILRLAPR